jgi:hypothetical protein
VDQAVEQDLAMAELAVLAQQIKAEQVALLALAMAVVVAVQIQLEQMAAVLEQAVVMAAQV